MSENTAQPIPHSTPDTLKKAQEAGKDLFAFQPWDEIPADYMKVSGSGADEDDGPDD